MSPTAHSSSSSTALAAGAGLGRQVQRARTSKSVSRLASWKRSLRPCADPADPVVLPPTHHHTHPKEEGYQPNPRPWKFTYTVVVFTGRAFFLTVAQAASLPCPPSPPSANTASRIMPFGEGRNRQTHGTAGRISPPPLDRPRYSAPGASVSFVHFAPASPGKPAATARLVRTYTVIAMAVRFFSSSLNSDVVAGS